MSFKTSVIQSVVIFTIANILMYFSSGSEERLCWLFMWFGSVGMAGAIYAKNWDRFNKNEE